MTVGKSGVTPLLSSGLDRFFLEEDPHHLEETVLVALDHMPHAEVSEAPPELGYRRFRVELDTGTALFPLNPGCAVHPLVIDYLPLAQQHRREGDEK
jgi:hypothetical protein